MSIPTDAELLELSAHHGVSYTMSSGEVVYPMQQGCDMRDDVLSFARAALARWGRPAIEPVPVAPANLELLAEFRSWYGDRYGRSYFGGIALKECVEWTQFVLARWGRPAIEPVPVSERLPGPEDCDAEGRCWWFSPPACGPHTIRPCWTFDSETLEGDTHWLPHWALPVPGVEGADA
jgi:hypothetical protein